MSRSVGREKANGCCRGPRCLDLEIFNLDGTNSYFKKTENIKKNWKGRIDRIDITLITNETLNFLLKSLQVKFGDWLTFSLFFDSFRFDFI